MPSHSHPRVYTDNNTLFSHFENLAAGDIVVGRLRLRKAEEGVIADLLSRGIELIPSGLSQLLSRSKILQATVFRNYLLPGTSAVHTTHDLQQTLIRYNRQRIGQVVTKQDRKDAGLGVHRWSCLEEVYNLATHGVLKFPFLVQPWLENFRDLRVLILGSRYLEAYERTNDSDFRRNLHFGGSSKSITPASELIARCRTIMDRGGFPYAHIDFLATEQGEFHLSEINLRGGIRGARIDADTYRHYIDGIHQDLVRDLTDHSHRRRP